jgi:hypothetical protein
MARCEPTKTIGNARAGCQKALTIHCLGPECHHQAVKTFEKLKLWNDMIFVDVPKYRRLVCSKCGSWNVKVMPIFPAALGHARLWQVVHGEFTDGDQPGVRMRKAGTVVLT